MKILVLGGTQFVGRHIVETLVAAGHSVSIFNRGKTADELPAHVERLRGDRDTGAIGLATLKGHVWDVCVDVSGFTARQVRASAEELRNSVGHYVFVSAVSAYGEPKSGPVYESQPRLPPAAEDVTEVNGDTYGRLKATCENIIEEIYADRCAMLRPQIVAGPHDPIDRVSYWVRRSTQGGEMLAPGDGSDHVQFIDARDVARFTKLVCEKSLQGSYNLAGPRLTWTKFMAVLDAQNVVWVPSSIIEGTGVTEFKLPLYRPTGSPKSNLMYVSNERAVQAGLALTDTKDTANHVRSWLPNCTLRPALSRKFEAALIRMAMKLKE
jgi:2'-hydroxyisoflavone reductase